jgi:short-subunit dehydrogenase
LFKGKTFVLTGATKGIGYYIAQNLSKNNAKFIFISRSQEDLDRLRNDLKKSAINQQ